MNYLVHLYLSGPDPELQLGGLMGDFVKGPIPAGCPERVACGLLLHRRIDTLAHNSDHTRRSRLKIRPQLRHGRGIVIDIFYDHFLAASWADYSPQPLELFAGQVYRLLGENFDRLPEGLQRIVPHMTRLDWLSSYARREVVGTALDRIALRLSRPLPLADSLADLVAHEAALRDDFTQFMAEAVAFTRTEFGIEVGQAP